MRFNDAIDQISDIRAHLARNLTFRGYRSLTTAFTGIVAVIAASIQSAWIGNGREALHDYLRLWFAAAIVSLTVVGIEIALRSWRSHIALQRELSFAAIEQFVPCIVAGAFVTYAIVQFSVEIAWILPALWMILFSMGAFASRRLLSRPIFFVGAYYLMAGLIALSTPRNIQLSPWMMGGVFGGGQLLAAAILYLTLERRHNENPGEPRDE